MSSRYGAPQLVDFAAARNVLPTSSREILAAGPSKAALHDAALRALDTFSALG